MLRMAANLLVSHVATRDCKVYIIGCDRTPNDFIVRT